MTYEYAINQVSKYNTMAYFYGEERGDLRREAKFANMRDMYQRIADKIKSEME